MKINEGKLLLLFSGILAGIFITILIVNTSLKQTTFLSYQDYEKMSMETNVLKNEIRGIRKEVNRLNDKLRIYGNSENKNKTISDTLKKELGDLKVFYGAHTVKGPGIKLTINDRHKKKYKDIYDLEFSTAHNEDLLYVVNDLKNAGAEAISVNGKRVIGSTSITCEGPVIMVNGQYIVPPFEILAIGDPDALNYAMVAQDYSKYKDLEIRNLELKIQKSNNLIIEGIDSINIPKYEKIVQ